MGTQEIEKMLKAPISKKQGSDAPFAEGEMKNSFNARFPNVPKAEFTELAIKVLKAAYPKACPKCGNIMENDVAKEESKICCGSCGNEESRLSHTPLQSFKMPLWVIGHILYSEFQKNERLTTDQITQALKIDPPIADRIRVRIDSLYKDIGLKAA